MYLMFALKVPIVALLWIVWWAIRSEPEPAHGESGGGGSSRRPHPRPPRPRRPRRDPHGDPAPPAPPRVRAVVARGRSLHR